MSPDGLWSIGELAEHAGVTVKTVRFYSDRGLLPDAGRSTGGHRRYGPEALDRLRLIRSLRTLDLPIPEVGRVLGAGDALDGELGDVIARRLDDIGSQLTALRWRESALRLVQECPPEQRADRLRLIGSLATPPNTTALARFWRRVLPVRLPARLVDSILDVAVAVPPDDPTPAQVLAFARLHALVTAPCPPGGNGPPLPPPGAPYRPAVLYDGLHEAYALAVAELTAGRTPAAGEALDCFVAAHAAARSARDTPEFRHGLAEQLAVETVMDRYWELAAELADPEPTMGDAHAWLRTALADPAR
ncbi:MerR family transcriptional regulator [Kitasatospora sp. NPDC048365]|uniref:helix-turn-helix domain-containing protein n=1 Tax=Kitasatospora sp. NPDC048365 TaxID=3364050 RepID=UPI003721FA10